MTYSPDSPVRISADCPFEELAGRTLRPHDADTEPLYTPFLTQGGVKFVYDGHLIPAIAGEDDDG